MKKMYVCLCNDVNEKDLAEAISEGADTLEKLVHALGVSTGCGACENMVKEILEDTVASKEPK